MTSFLGEVSQRRGGASAQRRANEKDGHMGTAERAVQPDPAGQSNDSLLQEFAAELTPSPEELEEAFGPDARSHDEPSARQAAHGQSSGSNIDMVMRIPVSVQVVLGAATMSVSGLVKLGRGAVIPLDRRVGEPVDVMVNGRLVARGEVVVMDEGSSRFGISLTEVVTGPGSAREP